MQVQVPSWRVHVATWLRFFAGTRLGPYHACPQHVIDGLLKLADGRRGGLRVTGAESDGGNGR